MCLCPLQFYAIGSGGGKHLTNAANNRVSEGKEKLKCKKLVKEKCVPCEFLVSLPSLSIGSGLVSIIGCRGGPCRSQTARHRDPDKKIKR